MERNTQQQQQQQGERENATPNTPLTVESQISKSESDGDVVFYMDEPRAGKHQKNYIVCKTFN